MRPFVALATLAAAAGLAVGLLVGSGERADALSVAEVIGVYRCRLAGDGYLRKGDNYKAGRVRGEAFIILTAANERNDGEVNVEIRLGPRLDNSILDQATAGSPDFVGTGLLVQNSLTVIDSGSVSPVFVSAVTLRFQKNGRKVSGWWIASVPTNADNVGQFTSGVGVHVKGRRVKERPNQPVQLPPASLGGALDR